MSNSTYPQDIVVDADLDLAPAFDYHKEQLRRILFGTFFVLVALAALGFLVFWEALGSLFFIPLGIVAAAAFASYIILEWWRKYDAAAVVYIVGCTLGLYAALIVNGELVPLVRSLTPFLLPLIVTMSGLLLADAAIYVILGISGLVFLYLRQPWPNIVYDVFALLIAAGAGALVRTTARSLRESSGAIESYLKIRARRDELFTMQQELKSALDERNWFNQELKRTNRALETSSKVGSQATSILKLDVLLPQVVGLLRESFDYYFVGIWLFSDKFDALTLRAGVVQKHSETLALKDLQITRDEPSIVMSVFDRGECRVVDDVLRAPDYLPLEDLPHTRSVLALPLRVGLRVMGVLDIQRRGIGAFSDDDRRVMQTLANQLSVAIRNAQLYTSEQYRRQVAESLERTGRELASSLDLNEIPGRILDQLADVVPYGRGSVWVREEDVIRAVAYRGFPPSYRDREMTMTLREGDVFAKIVSNKEPLLIDDTTQDPRFQQVAELEIHCSWLGIPLMAKERVLGMISLTRPEAGAFTSDDPQVVQAYAGQAAIALENARLVDEIRRFNEQLEQMVQARTEELEKAYNTLEKMDKNKSDFIRIAAHELRTPLTVVKGYVQMLNRPGVDNKMQPFIQGILSGTDRLHAIVNSMLEVAMIESQTLEIMKRSLYMWEVFERVEVAFREALVERNLTLTLDDIESIPPLEADPQLIYRVFDELVSNAIKYTPDGGEITVFGHEAALDGETAIEMVVQDTGIGIDPEFHEVIFEKFYQTGEVSVHSTGRTKYKGGGPGLGLALAKGIVLAHNGRIWVESPGHDEETCPGSEVHVLLPVGNVKQK